MSRKDGRSLIGTTIAERYELQEPLGSGGMATVYRAYQAALDRFVAVKIISSQLADDPTFAERFRREARTVARLRHRNILTIYDFGDDHGLLYLVTELVEGGTLQERLQEPLSPLAALDLLAQVGQALDYAHEQGIVHRDVKPSNIFLERGHGGDHAILADFGIAKATAEVTGAGLTSGGVIGTPEYMAPEQITGQPVDGQADLYALAVLAFRLLTGRLPYQMQGPDDSVLSLVMRKISTLPPPPTTLNSGLPPDLDAVLLKALAHNPNDRYPTAAAFVAAARATLAAHAESATTLLPTSQPTRQTAWTPAPAPPENAVPTVVTREASPTVSLPPSPIPTVVPTRQRRSSSLPLILGFAAMFVVILCLGGALLLVQSQPGRGATASPTAVATNTAIVAQVPAPVSPSVATSTALLPTATLAPTPPPSPTVTPTVAPTVTVPPTVAPTAPPTAPPTPPPSTAPGQSGEAREKVLQALLSLPGTSSGTVINLANGQEVASDEPGRVMPAASLIKLPIAGAAYKQVATGKWKTNDPFTLREEDKVGGTGILQNQPAGTTYTLDQLIEIMLLNSDNTAANMIVDRLGGFALVNSFCTENGMTNTVMRRRLFDLAAQQRGVDNTTTSGDIARYFTRLASNQIVNQQTSQRLLQILRQRGRQDKNWALLNLPPNVVAAHMTGTGAGVRNDVILVTESNGESYIQVLMVKDAEDGAMEQGLASASAAIYRVFVNR